jgi:hypothetical protein
MAQFILSTGFVRSGDWLSHATTNPLGVDLFLGMKTHAQQHVMFFSALY